MRVKSHIWVSGYLRRLNAAFINAVVVRRGDADAGAIYIKISHLDGYCCVFVPISTSIATGSEFDLLQEDGRAWHCAYKNAAELDVDTYLKKQASRDPDMWVIEIESVEGRHMLGDASLALS